MEHVYSLEKIIKPLGDVDYIINRELRQEKQKVEFQSHARVLKYDPGSSPTTYSSASTPRKPKPSILKKPSSFNL